MPKPLAGIRVIELANFIAGPLAGTLLADMGADVVKIEPPQGDMGRATPPIRDGESVSFVALNRNKRSLVLDLKRPQAIEILLKLARVSDVVLEAYRPGAGAGQRVDHRRRPHDRRGDGERRAPGLGGGRGVEKGGVELGREK